jgi:hypothetical protein
MTPVFIIIKFQMNNKIRQVKISAFDSSSTQNQLVFYAL